MPPREPAARSSRRPGPSGAAAWHLHHGVRGAATNPRPPGTREIQPKRQKAACSKRGPPAPAQICTRASRREAPRGPDNTVPVPKSYRDDFTPQRPELGGEVNSTGKSRPPRPQLRRPPT
ncbi:hypothetical protein NDU88_001477 [Pleurodeles waltl]|uniref:Uncharacterized protein n=1 Tax=Pleurodeles waltl TaxID=8319 RepID=A0AAV7U9F9_PLEWA|nr:hypothetical protein NDU88_001477 [Pleurodeles waltl]